MLDDPGAHPVVEVHLAVHKLVLEVDIDRPRRQGVGDPGQREVVRGDQADRAVVDQTADDRFRADRAVVRVRAVEELVKEEKQRDGTTRELDDLPHPGDLGIEPRSSRLERVLNPQRRAHVQRRKTAAAAARPGSRRRLAPH